MIFEIAVSVSLVTLTVALFFVIRKIEELSQYDETMREWSKDFKSAGNEHFRAFCEVARGAGFEIEVRKTLKNPYENLMLGAKPKFTKKVIVVPISKTPVGASVKTPKIRTSRKLKVQPVKVYKFDRGIKKK